MSVYSQGHQGNLHLLIQVDQQVLVILCHPADQYVIL